MSDEEAHKLAKEHGVEIAKYMTLDILLMNFLSKKLKKNYTTNIYLWTSC